MFQGNSSPNSTTPSGVSSSVFTLSGTTQNLGNLSLVVKLLESFGTVRVLSSPKISVLNNQSAILKVVNNLVYFTIRAETTSTANVATTSYTTTPNIVAVGFVMNVTPQIGENDTVLLNVKPTISRVSSYVNDPNPVLANPCGNGVANCSVPAIKSAIPQVQTREMESIIKVNSGQIAVMGGLIQDANSDVEDGVPGMNRIPFFGELFTQRNRSRSKTELIIFMRPVVVNDPSIDGDFRSMRSLLPDENFLGRGNPGKTSSGVPQ
jgi:general secretion pathway protein D